MQPNPLATLTRRTFTGLVAAAYAVGTRSFAAATPQDAAFASLRDRPLSIGILAFDRIDQIDLTGPFEVLVRIPDSSLHVIGIQNGTVRDHKGLVLTPDCTLATAPVLDVLVVPGGPGQQALMEDETVLAYLRSHHAAGKPVFSVCTGALLCGAAGLLRGRRATTHWGSFELLPYFGAIPTDARVVIDGTLVTAAGVTAGLDGALMLAALLRGDEIAQQIQLDIQYAPEPPFSAGSPHTAPASVLKTVREKYRVLTSERLATAKRVATRLERTNR